MGRAIRIVMVAMIVSALSLGFCSCSTGPDESKIQITDKPVARMGDTVFLFHGSHKLTKNAFCPNAVIPVYRTEGAGSAAIRSEVGKVKVVRELSEFYVEGVVVEGSVIDGDTAADKESSCMIKLK